MAVSIPRLEKIQGGSPLPSNDRINFQAQDSAQLINSQTSAVNSLGNTVGDIYQEYENDKIDQLSNEAEIAFTSWNDEQLNKIKQIEGDPTEAYNVYDEEVNRKYDEILESKPDLNNRVRNNVTARLNGVVQKNRVGMLKQRGAHLEAYDNNLFEATVGLKKKSLPETAGYIRPNDPSSTFMFDKSVNEMQTVILKQSLKKGTATKVEGDGAYDFAYQDDDGNIVKVKATDIAKQKLGKELSEGVNDSINVLIDGEQIQSAKILQNKYGSYLTAEAKTKIKNKIDGYNEKNAAANFYAGIQNKESSERIEAIKNIRDPKLKNDVLTLSNSIETKLENATERRDNEFSDTILKDIQQRSKQGEVITMYDLQNDTKYTKLMEKMSPKSIKAIEEAVEAPKVTNEASRQKMLDLLMGVDPNYDIGTIEPSVFYTKYLVGFNDADRKKYEAEFNQLRLPSADQKRSQYGEAYKLLQDTMLREGTIKYDSYGKITGKNLDKFLKMKRGLQETLSKQYGVLDSNKLPDFIDGFYARAIINDFKDPQAGMNAPKRTATQAPQEIVKAPAATPDSLVIKSTRQLQDEFRKAENRWPTAAELKALQDLQNK